MDSNDSERFRRPLIGLTTYAEQASMLVWDAAFALLHQVYVSAVVAAGGIAVLLPPQPYGAEEVVAHVDGVILSGGADVDPARYGGSRAPETGPPRQERDEWELAVVAAAVAAGRPVLGICRGAQLLNVALGGTLEQHVPDRVGHTGHQPGAGRFGRVPVRVDPDSRLASLLGEQVEVPCYHHQAIERVATALRPVAWAEDGTIEAVELPGPAYCVGVQWHPEQDAHDDGRLFASLVAAASAWRTVTAAPQRS